MLLVLLLESRQLTEGSFNQSHSKQFCRNDSECPTWFICHSNNECSCGNGSGAVVCDNQSQTSAVLDCHCVTYDRGSQSTLAGLCYYNCENHHSKKRNGLHVVTTQLPKRAEMLLNRSICNDFNRAGLLCGDCEDGYSPFVLSYNLSCVKCPDGHKNWWKFIVAGFLPLTLFYFFVLFFNINVTTSRLHGVVWFSQTLSIPALIRLMMLGIHNIYPQLNTTAKIFPIFYSFWNLDLFRSIIPNICLNVTTLQALALDYLIALYPFLLIVISYFTIELYDKKIPFIVAIWKPFQILFNSFRKSCDVRTSIIDSFATFFLLSYVKILSVTNDLLAPVHIHQLGSNKSIFGLYYTPTVRYFGNDHLPYAILALIILTIFVCVPTLILALYPFRFFQVFLSYYSLNLHFLHAFVDSFQGCYKDGTQPGTFDCRWFAVLMLLLRPLQFVLFTLTLSLMFFVYAVILLIIYLILMVNIQPFKRNTVRYPLIDQVFLILLTFFYFLIIGGAVTTNDFFFITISVLTISSATLPLLYIAYIICFWLISKLRCAHLLSLVNRFRHQQ